LASSIEYFVFKPNYGKYKKQLYMTIPILKKGRTTCVGFPKVPWASIKISGTYTG